jgi:hypothetical protein
MMRQMPEFRRFQSFQEQFSRNRRLFDQSLGGRRFFRIPGGVTHLLRAQNVSPLSRATGLRRDRLYKTFDGKIEPDFRRILKLPEGLEVQLVVVLRECPKPKPKPELLKLGRPRTRHENKGSIQICPIQVKTVPDSPETLLPVFSEQRT